MDIKNYLSREKKGIDTRIEFHIENFKNQFKQVSSRNNDLFDRLNLFCQGGKGVRGGLFISIAEMFGFSDKSILLDIAATLEILHASLLIHDDITDNDELRRGHTSLYAQYIPIGTSIGSSQISDFSKSMGMWVGDISFFTALSIFQKTANNLEKKDELYKILFQKLITVSMGQLDDIMFSHSKKIPTIEDIIRMYEYKTAEYTFSLPFILAATVTNQSKKTVDILENIGLNIGILFQIRDDEIGLFSTETTIGKPIGSDIRENKKTILRAFLEKNLSETEKIYMGNISKKKDLSSNDIQKVLNLFKKYRIQDFIKTITNKYYSQAISEIQSLPVSKKNKKIFTDLTDYVMTRAT